MEGPNLGKIVPYPCLFASNPPTHVSSKTTFLYLWTLPCSPHVKRIWWSSPTSLMPTNCATPPLPRANDLERAPAENGRCSERQPPFLRARPPVLPPGRAATSHLRRRSRAGARAEDATPATVSLPCAPLSNRIGLPPLHSFVRQRRSPSLAQLLPASFLASSAIVTRCGRAEATVAWVTRQGRRLGRARLALAAHGRQVAA
jgi:hypothetical protein